MGELVPNVLHRAENRVDQAQREAGWDTAQFEAEASHEFFMAAAYGDKLGKHMAVLTNPMAKMCGEIVMNAMKQEL